MIHYKIVENRDYSYSVYVSGWFKYHEVDGGKTYSSIDSAMKSIDTGVSSIIRIKPYLGKR